MRHVNNLLGTSHSKGNSTEAAEKRFGILQPGQALKDPNRHGERPKYPYNEYQSRMGRQFNPGAGARFSSIGTVSE